MAMKCGECLMRDVKMVDLVDGVCPACGADYRGDVLASVVFKSKPTKTVTGWHGETLPRDMDEGRE